MQKYINITLDGPSGSGKTTIAKLLAKKLNFEYVDTGAMYRAVAYYVLSHGVKVDNESEVLKLLPEIDVQLKTENDVQLIFVNGQDITNLIRTPEISMGASTVSKIKEVRLKLVTMQRKLASEGNTIFDGRDMGSFVLPNADFKFYLTADTDVRAKRRYDELLGKGQNLNFEDVKANMIARDEQDSSRAFAPLVIPKGAVVIDTSKLDTNEVLSTIEDNIKL